MMMILMGMVTVMTMTKAIVCRTCQNIYDLVKLFSPTANGRLVAIMMKINFNIPMMFRLVAMSTMIIKISTRGLVMFRGIMMTMTMTMMTRMTKIKIMTSLLTMVNG